ncbi:MAG: glycosyltransferase involved in cell wall biosynthesis [Acidimicrobiales bacterium]|jgi:glycosyltransferase involved in cell wall biosynthesis
MIIELCTPGKEKILAGTVFSHSERFQEVLITSFVQLLFLNGLFLLFHPVLLVQLVLMCVSTERLSSCRRGNSLSKMFLCNAQYMKAKLYPYAVIEDGYLQLVHYLCEQNGSVEKMKRMIRRILKSDHYILSDLTGSAKCMRSDREVADIKISLAPATVSLIDREVDIQQLVQEHETAQFMRYITFARMPTEKAHGLQIAKMCEAFLSLNFFVSLVTPTRSNPIRESVVDYYKLNQFLQHWKVPVFDITGHIKEMKSIHHYLHELLFMCSVVGMRIPKEVIVYTRTPLIAFVCGLRRRKVIIEEHYWPTRGAWVHTRLLASATHIACNSEGTRDACIQHGLLQASVAHNGFDDALLQEAITKHDARRGLGLANTGKVVMYIGSLGDWKGVDTLAKAAVNFDEDCTALVIGGTEKELSSWREKYPHVVFLGPRPYDEIGVHQRAADILIVPNNPITKESCEYTSPIKLFAHMASGIPLLVSNLPSLRAIVGNEEVTFFTPGDSDSLAAAVAQIFDDYEGARYKSMHTQKVSSKFTWKSRATSILKASTLL